MPEEKQIVSKERIESFLQGTDPQKYIVSLEPRYDEPIVDLIINDPEKGKYIQQCKYQPFLWFKHDIVEQLYGGKRAEATKALKPFGVSIVKLKTQAPDGSAPARLAEGFIYLAKSKMSYNSLLNYFKNGGIDPFKNKDSFLMFSPQEQFMIQTGKRMFKGFEDYNEVHRFQFDLETEGLQASRNAIFQIGIRDNKTLKEGYILETTGDTPQERRNSERENIRKFFKIISAVNPDIIAGYNSENFDWTFLFERCERLSMSITEVAQTLNRASKIKRREAHVKFGGETEAYMQTHMYGFSIIDVSHAVRRAMAINSEIKSWGLKYITKFSNVEKKNRVYVAGDKINTTWADKVNQYAFNDDNGDWYKISDKFPLKDGYVITTGAYIVERYLKDDLWETEQIDYIFNQASFLIGKMLPTSYQKSSTMGTASQWKLIMAAWSYENGLAVPIVEKKRDFTGGLSRLLKVGFAKRYAKLDFAALYPKTELTHDIFPDLDISGVMKGLLTYIVETRDLYKNLTGDEKAEYKKLEKELEANKATYSPEKIEELKAVISKHKSLASLYDKKQLPLKILANSWFGSYGASYIFNWGDVNCAEETTCRGRQYLRHMVRFFNTKYNFEPLVLDTDGCNFELPDDIDTNPKYTYVAMGTHWKTTKLAGKTLKGLDAALADFNENELTGKMGLDVDEVGTSTINFARKNYANNVDGKLKFVGNSIKSKKISYYVEEFLNKGIRLLLEDKGAEFVNLYYSYADMIYNGELPIVGISSKAKVKQSIKEYGARMSMPNKNGKPRAKQAHMELAIKDGLDVNLGDVIYYVNTGTAKSHGDLKSEVDKTTKAKKIVFNCTRIENAIVDRDSETMKEIEILNKSLTKISNEEERTVIEARIKELDGTLARGTYNVARYLDALNKKVKPLLVCFDKSIRDEILLDIVKIKDKATKTKVERLKEKKFFTESQCKLVSGQPKKDVDQDSYEQLMIMEDKEIKFWDRVNKVPNNINPEEFEKIRVDYIERFAKEKSEGIENEKKKVEDIVKHLELTDLNNIKKGRLPLSLATFLILPENSRLFYSAKWEEPICDVFDFFKFENEAKERDLFYVKMKLIDKDDRYQQYLDFKNNELIMTGHSETVTGIVSITEDDSMVIAERIRENPDNRLNVNDKGLINPKSIKLEENDESEEEDESEETSKSDDEVIQLDDGIDEMIPEIPDNYDSKPLVQITEPIRQQVTEEKDEWNF